MFPITLITALASERTVITGSSYTADNATKPDSQRTKNAQYIHSCKGTTNIGIYQRNLKNSRLRIQIVLYAVKHICIKFHFVTIVNDEIDFSFEQGVVH